MTMTPTIIVKSSAIDASQVLLTSNPATWILQVGQGSIHQPAKLVTAVHVAPLLTLLTRDLGLEIVGGPPLDPTTFTDQKRYGWKLLAATGDLDVIVSMFVEAPEARMTASGSLIVEPSNYPAYVGISVAGKDARGRTFRQNGSYRAQDIVAALITLFPLTITDPRRVLTRHLRPAPPAFEVFDDGTTAPLTAGDVR